MIPEDTDGLILTDLSTCYTFIAHPASHINLWLMNNEVNISTSEYLFDIMDPPFQYEAN